MTGDRLVKLIEGSVYGLAFGDAYGWPNEFRSFQQISYSFSDFPSPAIITDDTQMSLYALQGAVQLFHEDELGSSLIKRYTANPEQYEAEIRKVFAEKFLDWLNDPRNDRAPGINCLATLRKLEGTQVKNTWMEGTSNESKGCGANMRNPWFGLLPATEDIIVDLSILQSSVTHNHPLALSSAVLTALAVKTLKDGKETSSLFDFLVTKTEELIRKGHKNKTYMEGLQELLLFFNSSRLEYTEFMTSGDDEDICAFLGEGKVAEEALLLAAAAYDMYDEDVSNGLRRLANSGGDSDSIAAIGGAFFGAAYGIESFPREWKQELEVGYSVELQEAVNIIITC